MSRHLVVAVVMVAAVAGTAAADSRARAHEAFATAQAAYTAGDYRTAVARYKEAYTLDPDPVYLFDTAQALRLSDECAEAATYYHRFLDVVPDPPSLDKITQLVADVEKCAADAAAAAEPPAGSDATEPAPPPRRHHKHKPDPSGLDAALAAGPGADDTAPRHPVRTPGIAAVAVGAVSLGAGIFFTHRASDDATDRSAICPHGCMWTGALAKQEADDDASGRTASHLAIGGFALGAVALTAGILLYLHVEHPPTIGVGVGPGGATVSANLVF